ncbi:hypothetical protein KKB18_02385, partial [bacterium]|nr:hypothetical protein [bacterium]
MIKSSTAIRIFFLLAIVFSYNALLSAEWIENNNFGFGNLSFTLSGSTHGFFLKIPDSPYMVYYKHRNIIIFDVNDIKIRGGRLMPPGSYYDSFCVIPDPVSGWNLFYYYDNENTKEKKNGKLHIEPDGQFGEDRLLMDDPSKVALPIGIPERSQVWFFADKILRLNVIYDSWSEFNYPKGWDSDSRVANAFQNLSYNSMIIISYIEATSDFQALILNIDTGETKLITAEKGFFDYKLTIEAWNFHPDKYIIRKESEIYSYDSQTNKIELLMKDLGFEVLSIMQDESGRKLYVLRDTAVFVLDLINKTVETHEIPLQEGFVFYSTGIYDLTRKKIISELGKNMFDYRIFGIINLEDFTIEYLENLSESSS